MLIISVTDIENDRWMRITQKKQRQKRTRDTKIPMKGWELNDSVVRLISKASLIFKSNLELALSIILNKRELYESKHVAVECGCLKIWDLTSFLICSLILVLKLQQVLPI